MEDVGNKKKIIKKAKFQDNKVVPGYGRSDGQSLFCNIYVDFPNSLPSWSRIRNEVSNIQVNYTEIKYRE